MKNKKILVVEVVEDEVSLRKVLHDKLAQDGFTILEAKNGEEGLEVALREHPDLILLDIVMPKMDGMTMLKRLRGNVWGKKAKVIILTNLSDSSKVAEAVAEESYDYLIKSNWKIEEVMAKIHARLEE